MTWRFRVVEPLPRRKITLAITHLVPKRSTPEKNRELLGELAVKAGQSGADLVVLSEAIAVVGTGSKAIDVAAVCAGTYDRYSYNH